MEGLVVGSGNAGSINQFIVALICQHQSGKTGRRSKAIGWKSVKSISAKSAGARVCPRRAPVQNPEQVLDRREEHKN